MALLNYTTSIDVLKTVGEITAMLVSHGARSIATGYGLGGQPESIAFLVPTQFGDRSFRLPSRWESVHKTLADQFKNRNRSKEYRNLQRQHTTPEHARRVAWRITKDWVEAQLAFIESGMVTLEEVMLPFMLGKNDQTVYQVMVSQHLALEGPKR